MRSTKNGIRVDSSESSILDSSRLRYQRSFAKARSMRFWRARACELVFCSAAILPVVALPNIPPKLSSQQRSTLIASTVPTASGSAVPVLEARRSATRVTSTETALTTCLLVQITVKALSCLEAQVALMRYWPPTRSMAITDSQSLAGPPQRSAERVILMETASTT